MTKINGSILLNNIYYFANKLNLKIGELEKAIGVSSGYFSKLSKEGNVSLPGSEVLITLADFFNISIESFVNVDFSFLSETEILLLNFLDKIINKTSSLSIEWFSQSPSILSNSDTFNHPLFDYKIQNNHRSKSKKYFSSFWFLKEDCDAEPNGDIYFFNYSSDTFYLVPVIVSEHSNEFHGYELYIFSNGKIEEICCTKYDSNFEINNKLELLFKTVTKYFKSPKIGKNVKNVLDHFMSDNSI